jgi:predicted transcriptional regulator
MRADDVPPRDALISPGVAIRTEAYIGWTVDLVRSFILMNSIQAADLPPLIASIYASLTRLERVTQSAPAVTVSDSVHDDYLVCLEDGKKLKTLRRYLQRAFNMTPEDYRRKWDLPDDYPMVAPAYSRTRSGIARRATRPNET